MSAERPAASVDRFVCRREGHKPALKFTSMRASGMPAPKTYITTCLHCGKSVEFKVGEAGEEAESDA